MSCMKSGWVAQEMREDLSLIIREHVDVMDIDRRIQNKNETHLA